MIYKNDYASKDLMSFTLKKLSEPNQQIYSYLKYNHYSSPTITIFHNHHYSSSIIPS